MTTISTNRRRKKIRPSTAAFLIVITILLVLGLLWREPMANLLWKLLEPVLLTRNTATSASVGFFGQFGSNAELARENQALKEALASSSIIVSDRNILYAENQELKRLLGRTAGERVVLAAVIMRPPGIPYGTLMLDVGKDNGVREGDLVAAEGSVYIGRISDAYDSTSRVTLFSAPGQSYQGLLRGVVPVALSGEGSGSLMGEVPTGIEVSPGDPVLLPAISPQYVAKITAVMRTEGQSFQSLYLSLPANPLELRFVIVHLSAATNATN